MLGIFYQIINSKRMVGRLEGSWGKIKIKKKPEQWNNISKDIGCRYHCRFKYYFDLDFTCYLSANLLKSTSTMEIKLYEYQSQKLVILMLVPKERPSLVCY